MAHGERMARSVSLQLSECANVALPGLGKCVETNRCGWKRVGGSLALTTFQHESFIKSSADAAHVAVEPVLPLLHGGGARWW